ncbi:hypothetical protein D9M69_479860 [compost metagenome]
MRGKDRSKFGIIAEFEQDRQEKAHSFLLEEKSRQHFLQRNISPTALPFSPLVGRIKQRDVKVCLAWKIIGQVRLAEPGDFGDLRLRQRPYALRLDNVQGSIEDELALVRLLCGQDERLPFPFLLSHC